MNVNILALVVVFGEDPFATSSLQTLMAAPFPRDRLRIIVWDNSPQPRSDIAALADAGVEYHSTPENLGLSVIYNRVIAQHLREGEHLLLLDQDSKLPSKFLTSCESAVANNPDIDLFLPMIKAQGRWVSPLTYLLGWGRYWTSPRTGRIASRRVCAINSGMFISATYLKGDSPGYDENLCFYGTDTQFMLDFMERRQALVVLDLHIDHDLSFFSHEVGVDRARKFSAMRSATLYLYKNRPLLQRLSVNALMGLISLRYAFRYRTWAFVGSKS